MGNISERTLEECWSTLQRVSWTLSPFKIPLLFLLVAQLPTTSRYYFFFPPSLSFLTLSIYLLLLFFFPSLVNSYTRKDSPSFVHPINHFSLLFFHIFFFNYNNTSPARYIDCVVYAIVSSLAKSSRFLRTIIRTNRSSLFPLPCFFFFFPSSRRIRIVSRLFFTRPPFHSFFLVTLIAQSLYRSSSMLYVRVCASPLADIYLLIYIHLLVIYYIFLIL